MAVILISGVAEQLVTYRRVPSPPLAIATGVVIVQAVSLYWRRRHPLAVFAMVACAMLLGAFLGIRASEGPAVFVAAYSVSVYAQPQPRLAVAALGVIAVFGGLGGSLILRSDAWGTALAVGASSLVAWVIGDYTRNRRQYLVDLQARAHVLEQQSEENRRQAAEEERLRIARELHDVVSHNVSVMAIQAGAARLAGGEAVPQSLRSIELTARDTLAELNRLLGVLRRSDAGGPSRSPQPGIAQLEDLLAAARESGLQAQLRTTGEPRALPAALDLSAYRIVQEAVTNALRHSGAGRLEVRIDYASSSLTLAISDDGRGASPDSLTASAGHGLVGMRERVEIFGGRLETATSPLGGFTVRALLPLDAQ
ncbi:MAG: sensor histidine kinase [Candidatus Dormibacteraeota bacterium]|nr:sensor histidine kinase [Candidatus Dormibacteraeota bacterium]